MTGPLHQVDPAGRRHHDFGHEVADGGGGLLGLQLGEDVALVLVTVGALLGHEAEHASAANKTGHDILTSFSNTQITGT